MEIRLDGKIMLVTGASTGIGRAIALEAARSGADVVINYRSSDAEATELEEEITKLGVRCLKIKADVTSEEKVIDMFGAIEKELGSSPEVLVNNAGSMIKRSPISEMPLDVWEKVVAVNMTSVFLCSREALKKMIPKKSGVIINITSIAAYTGGGPGSCAYASTKGAINTFTVGLAKEGAKHGIRVMAVGPGVIETPFHDKFTSSERMKSFEDTIPLGRVGTSEDIAPLVVFLASDHASFATGHHFDVTGGM
ncbi:MAG: glucose 1-dehydrogenase [Deltaproteobacteria bacterium]